MMPDLPSLLAPRLRCPAIDLPPLLTMWEVSLQEPTAPASCEAILSAGELGRADAFRFPNLRRRHVWCRLALRHLLGARLGCMARDVALQYSPAGRPFVAGATWDFNLSHSADVAFVALLEGGGRIGMDVEAMVPLTDMGHLARRVFTQQEVGQSQEGVPPLEAFYRRWTCKEAYLKALGTGLRIDPRSVALSFASNGEAAVLEGPVTAECRLVSFMPRLGFMAAFAILADAPA